MKGMSASRVESSAQVSSCGLYYKHIRIVIYYHNSGLYYKCKLCILSLVSVKLIMILRYFMSVISATLRA